MNRSKHPARPPRTTRRPLVLTALLLAMFVTAIEGTIVATAMPSIASQLGGFSIYSWVFSAYLLTQAATIPIFGKLADLYGRKPIFVIGTVLFLVGSLLCGLADSMGLLVAFRFIQGVGAGAMQPITVTLLGDLYRFEERGRVQAYAASVWGGSSVIGPLSGGLIVEYGHWPWVFWMSIPIGLLAIGLVHRYLHETVAVKPHSIDYTGASLFFVGLSAFMLAATQSSVWGWDLLGLLLALALAALVLFAGRERRAREPMLHLELWKDPLIARANGASFTAGMVMMGLIGYLPTFVQGVHGGSPLAAGFALSAMTAGWPLASVFAARLVISRGSRLGARLGGASMLVGTVLIVALAEQGVIGAAIGSFCVGLGLGFLNTTFVVSIQSSVGWERRGIATATNLLMRILGSALGAALFGGLLNVSLQRYLDERGLLGQVSLESITDLLNHHGGAQLSEALLAVMHDGLAQGLDRVFWGLVLLGLATALVSWRLPDLKKPT